MGILERFTDIMASNVNAILDKLEDPSKMVDQYLVKMKKNLAEVKKETAGVIAEEKRTKRMYDDNRKEVERYIGLTEKALLANNESDALVFMGKKQELDSVAVSLQETYAVARENATKMRQMHDKITKEIIVLESRKNMIKSKAAVAKTQESVNKYTSKAGSVGMGAFERMEEKIDAKLDRATAMAELNEEPLDAAQDLAKKYASVANTSSANAELEEMKRKLGLVKDEVILEPQPIQNYPPPISVNYKTNK